MKRNLTLILSCCGLMLSACNHSKPTDCRKFRDGVFKMIDPLHGVYIIDRHGDSQVEHKQGDTLMYTLKIHWLNDCSYTLVPDSNLLKKFPTLPKDTTTTNIVSTSDNSYFAETSRSGGGDKQTTEIIKTGD